MASALDGEKQRSTASRQGNHTWSRCSRGSSRTGTGRGYSSNAELDFHTDSSDVVFLSCYNKALQGGMSITTSSIAAYEVMAKEFPDLAEYLRKPVHFSRQGEEAPDEAPSYPHPIFDEQDGKLFSKWNRNRVTSAQKLPGVPQLTSEHWRALETFDRIVRREDLAHTMWLEPGDIQIINSHVTLHSRTEFADHAEPEKKRLLFRLWLAPADSDRLPESWRVLFNAVEPGTASAITPAVSSTVASAGRPRADPYLDDIVVLARLEAEGLHEALDVVGAAAREARYPDGLSFEIGEAFHPGFAGQRDTENIAADGGVVKAHVSALLDRDHGARRVADREIRPTADDELHRGGRARHGIHFHFQPFLLEVPEVDGQRTRIGEGRGDLGLRMQQRDFLQPLGTCLLQGCAPCQRQRQ